MKEWERVNEGGRQGEKERDGEREGGRCKRLMRESEKRILTSLWPGRLRKIREIEGGRDGLITSTTCQPARYL